jgi:hypothetical protein
LRSRHWSCRSLADRRLNPFGHILHAVRQLRLQRIGHRNSAWMDRNVVYVINRCRIEHRCETEFDGRLGFIFHDLEINLGLIVRRLATDNEAAPPATCGPSAQISRNFVIRFKLKYFRLRACLKIVVSAILADVEPWLPARRKTCGHGNGLVKYIARVRRMVFSGRQDAALYGRRDARRYFSDRLLGVAAVVI